MACEEVQYLLFDARGHEYSGHERLLGDGGDLLDTILRQILKDHRWELGHVELSRQGAFELRVDKTVGETRRVPLELVEQVFRLVPRKGRARVVFHEEGVRPDIGFQLIKDLESLRREG